VCVCLSVVVHVDGVRLCISTAATSGSFVHTQIICVYGEPWWDDIDRENRRTRRKTCPTASLSTTNPTWTDPGMNLCLRSEKPATNRLSHENLENSNKAAKNPNHYLSLLN
jgi:hypothetical protein